jgi:hypothetical protein
MIDKTMCEVLRRNISDFYVILRVEVAAVSRNRYDVETTVDMYLSIFYEYQQLSKQYLFRDTAARLL